MVNLDIKPPDNNRIPPTYLDCLRRNLAPKGRSNVNERDRRILQYIRTLQEERRQFGIFSFVRRGSPGNRIFP